MQGGGCAVAHEILWARDQYRSRLRGQGIWSQQNGSLQPIVCAGCDNLARVVDTDGFRELKEIFLLNETREVKHFPVLPEKSVFGPARVFVPSDDLAGGIDGYGGTIAPRSTQRAKVVKD